MKSFLIVFTLLLFASNGFCGIIEVSSDLQNAINIAADGDTIVLAAGRYEAHPEPFVEDQCGNCQEARAEVHASRGFVVEAKHLVIRGGRRYADAILETHAGYGLLILNCPEVVIENVTITGGRRDPDGKATDAAIVVKGSAATIRNCWISDNTDFIDSTIVGIGGVMVREGSTVTIERCSLVNNSWDGVALYRGAEAWITDCKIDSGRGVGIGVTWDAVAVVERNSISHYWKGIGSFGTATVVARNNLVFDNLGWGIIASGVSSMIAENNTVAHNGNCGIAIWNKGARGRIVNNISVRNGWRKEWVCPCVGMWNQESDTAGWEISHNLLWGNQAGNVLGMDSTRFMVTDPQFADTTEFHLAKESPAWNAGDPVLKNPDGSRSHIGNTGGPRAGRR
jgi:hypothetical protein